MLMPLLAVFCVLALCLDPSQCKMFKPCELAAVLLDNDINVEDISTWMCIARYESTFNSSAVGHMSGDGSLDHGIFQINDRYWCTDADDDILACGITCRALEDDDLTDDIACARRIYRQHKRLAGDGWSAWAVYPYYCTSKEKNDQRFLKNNNCSLNSISGALSSKLQLLPVSPIPYQPFHYPQPSPFPTTVSTSGSNSYYSPFTSTATPATLFNSNKFSAFTSSVPPPNSVFNSNKHSQFPPSFFPSTTSIYQYNPSPSPPVFNNQISHVTSTQPPLSSTRFPSGPSGINRFQFASTTSSARPSNSIFTFNTKSQFSPLARFPSVFGTG